jgi:hypothetical protein
MDEGTPDSIYELECEQNAELVALARMRSEEPQLLVREAVAKYLLDADYELRRKAAFANLRHPGRDNSLFGSLRDAGIDGVAFQNALRSE